MRTETNQPLAMVEIHHLLHRRHMTAGQQAAIVASAQDWAKAHPQGQTKKHQSNQSVNETGSVTGLDTVAARRAQSGASDKTQRIADKVAKEALATAPAPNPALRWVFCCHLPTNLIVGDASKASADGGNDAQNSALLATWWLHDNRQTKST